MLSYYWIVLFVTSLKYPRSLGSQPVELDRYPAVSILIATFNERFVIERSLDAVKNLDYPLARVQVVVADDSTDSTIHVIDEKVKELNKLGIRGVVSRRQSRDSFKCGALNQAMKLVDGEYVLLLDADSIIPPDILSKGVYALETHPRTSFVSFRYGHYNRNYNLVTRLFPNSRHWRYTLKNGFLLD